MPVICELILLDAPTHAEDAALLATELSLVTEREEFLAARSLAVEFIAGKDDDEDDDEDDFEDEDDFDDEGDEDDDFDFDDEDDEFDDEDDLEDDEFDDEEDDDL